MEQRCEMVENKLCLGCVGLAEKDWQGKHTCKYYKEIKEKIHGYKNSAISKVKKE